MTIIADGESDEDAKTRLLAGIERVARAEERKMMKFTNAELGRSANENTVRTLHTVLAELEQNLKLGEYQRVYGTATREKESQAWAKAHSAWSQATAHDGSISISLPAAWSRYEAVSLA